MASIKLSALISDIRGKSNGSYFAKRKNTIVMANNPHKSGNNKAGQNRLQQARNAVHFVSSSWKDVGELDRLSWNNAAALLTWYTKVGEPYTPTGYAYYNQCNLNLAAQGLPPIVTPFVPAAAFNLSTIDIVVLNADIIIEYTPVTMLMAAAPMAAPTLGIDVVVYASWSNSYGTNYPKGGYKKIEVINDWDGTTINLLDGYEKTFGSFVATGYSYYRIDVLDAGTGILNGSRVTKVDSGRTD